MKQLKYVILIILLIVSSELTFAQKFEYIFPKNNSILVSLSTDIILESNENIDKTSLTQSEFKVVGSLSGVHNGDVKLSDDNKTILFLPNNKFSPNEVVGVIVNPGISTVSGIKFSQVSFQFKTTPLSHRIYLNPRSLIGNELNSNINLTSMKKTIPRLNSAQTLPSDFPLITVDSSNNPAVGNIFLTNFLLAPSDSVGNYLIIANNDGSIAKYKKLNQISTDFKVLPNGDLSYSEVLINYGTYAQVKWIVTDTSLTPIDSFQCGNGYVADLHDFLLLPNGHAVLIAYDPERVDMSQYGGSDTAVVIGAIIQELDASKNVVFQWRSWDAIPDTDSYIDLTTQTVDLIHANSIDTDPDGNFILSMRHLSIIKIDRQTGNTDWILGGKQNQFTFVNEHASNAPNYFSFQHDVRLLPNGDLTLFDNGNQHNPNYSRAVEYNLDQSNKTATLVWEYRHNPDIYSMAMGSVQKLSNGNTFIGWGIASSGGSVAVTELHPDNSIALELSLPPGQMSYRAYKFPWVSQQAKATASITELLQSNTYKFIHPDTTGISIKFNQISSSLYATANVSSYVYAPLKPTFTGTAPIILPSYFDIQLLGVSTYTGEVYVNLKYFPAVTNPQETIVYGRTNKDSNFVPITTTYDSTKDELVFTTSMTGDFTFGNSVITDVADKNNIIKSYKLYQNYPNPFNPSTVIGYTIPEESQVRIDIFNAIGQRVTTLVNGMKMSGNYEIRWNAANLSSGVYFYSIKSTGNSGKDFFSVKKMILLK